MYFKTRLAEEEYFSGIPGGFFDVATPETYLDARVRMIAADLDHYLVVHSVRELFVTRVFEPVPGEKTKVHSEGRGVDGRISYRTRPDGPVAWHIPQKTAEKAQEYINARWTLPEKFGSGAPMLPCIVHPDPRDREVIHFHLQIGRSRKVVRIG